MSIIDKEIVALKIWTISTNQIEQGTGINVLKSSSDFYHCLFLREKYFLKISAS